MNKEDRIVILNFLLKKSGIVCPIDFNSGWWPQSSNSFESGIYRKSKRLLNRNNKNKRRKQSLKRNRFPVRKRSIRRYQCLTRRSRRYRKRVEISIGLLIPGWRGTTLWELTRRKSILELLIKRIFRKLRLRKQT